MDYLIFKFLLALSMFAHFGQAQDCSYVKDLPLPDNAKPVVYFQASGWALSLTCNAVLQAGSTATCAKNGMLFWHEDTTNKPAVCTGMYAKLHEHHGSKVKFITGCQDYVDDYSWRAHCKSNSISHIADVGHDIHFDIRLSNQPQAADISFLPTQSQLSGKGITKTFYYIRHGHSWYNEFAEKGAELKKASGPLLACNLWVGQDVLGNLCALDSNPTPGQEPVWDSPLHEKGKQDALALKSVISNVNELSAAGSKNLYIASPLKRAFGTLVTAISTLPGASLTPKPIIHVHTGFQEKGDYTDGYSDILQPKNVPGHLPTIDGNFQAKANTEMGTYVDTIEPSLSQTYTGDWTTFISKEAYKTFNGDNTIRQWPVTASYMRVKMAFKDVFDLAMKEDKDNVVIGAHSMIMKSKYAVYAATHSKDAAAKARWEKLTGKKMENGAVLKFTITMDHERRLDFGLPEFTYGCMKDTQDGQENDFCPHKKPAENHASDSGGPTPGNSQASVTPTTPDSKVVTPTTPDSKVSESLKLSDPMQLSYLCVGIGLFMFVIVRNFGWKKHTVEAKRPLLIYP